MKKLIQLSAIIILLASVASCRKEIPLNLDTYEPKIAVSCLFEQDSNFYFYVTESQSPLDNDTFPALQNATITITNSLGKTETITVMVDHDYYYNTKQEYKSNMKVMPGLTYNVSVDHADFGTATASASVPTGTQISRLDTMSVIEFGFPALRFNLSFKDPAETNYYTLKVFAYAPEVIYDKNTWLPIDTAMTFQEVYYSMPSDGLIGGNGSVFSDELFNGTEYSFSFTVDQYYLDYVMTQLPEFSSERRFMLVELRSLSNEYYKYQTTLNSFWNADGNPFAQPVQVFSNVNGGFGIFAGFGKSSDTLFFD